MYHELLVTHPIVPTPDMMGAPTETTKPPEMLGPEQYHLLHVLAQDPIIVGYNRPGINATSAERNEWQRRYDRVRLAATYLKEEQDALSWDGAVAAMRSGGDLKGAHLGHPKGSHETQVTEAFDTAIRDSDSFSAPLRRLGVRAVALASKNGAQKALIDREKAGDDVFGVRHMRGVPEHAIVFEGAKRPVINALDAIAVQYETELYGPVIERVRQKAAEVSDAQVDWERKHGTLTHHPLHGNEFSAKEGGVKPSRTALVSAADTAGMPQPSLDRLLDGTMSDSAREQWNTKLYVRMSETARRAARRALRDEGGAAISGNELVRRMGLPAGVAGGVFSDLVAISMLKRSADGGHFSATPNLRARRFNLLVSVKEVGSAMLADVRRGGA